MHVEYLKTLRIFFAIKKYMPLLNFSYLVKIILKAMIKNILKLKCSYKVEQSRL